MKNIHPVYNIKVSYYNVATHIPNISVGPVVRRSKVSKSKAFGLGLNYVWFLGTDDQERADEGPSPG